MFFRSFGSRVKLGVRPQLLVNWKTTLPQALRWCAVLASDAVNSIDRQRWILVLEKMTIVSHTRRRHCGDDEGNTQKTRKKWFEKENQLIFYMKIVLSLQSIIKWQLASLYLVVFCKHETIKDLLDHRTNVFLDCPKVSKVISANCCSSKNDNISGVLFSANFPISTWKHDYNSIESVDAK